ncbi:MAG: DUF1343 domain-containing protein, partial [Elusimicrobia bacterium]|nr:DUF1343 domain-containing protein [Elusimicrobiota bacterium]
RGASYAGEGVGDSRDPATGLPVYSLFGATPKPTAEMLKGVDVVVYDLQDLGTRSYTFATTLALVMEAAADAGVPVVVLDRPDPLGGLRVEGNVPPPRWHRSFVCWLRVPYVYGLTPGELARMIDGEGWLPGGKKAKLTVVPMKGWRRSMLFQDTGLPWVPTSPHIPHAETTPFYPMTGLAGPFLNNGVGYTAPFEYLAAPWVDADRFAEKMNALKLPGLYFRSTAYKPFYAAYKGRVCRGVQVHILDPRRAPLFPVSFYALDVLNRMYPEKRLLADAPRRPQVWWERLLGIPAEPRYDWGDWEDAVGDPSIRKELAGGRSMKSFLGYWKRGREDFLRRRRKYLLY